jgi:hypothetical protein
LAGAGLIKGETVGGKTYFYPERTITREEAVTIIGRSLHVADVDISGAGEPFPDFSKVHDWAKPSVAVLYGQKWISGFDDGLFYPQNTLTRGQAAKIISKYAGL